MTSDSFRGVSTAADAGGAQMDRETGVAAIKASDPQFEEEAFRGRGQQAFYALQRAWQDRDLSASRPFMSPGLYLGWSSQVRQLVDLHKKNVLEGLRMGRKGDLRQQIAVTVHRVLDVSAFGGGPDHREEHPGQGVSQLRRASGNQPG